MEMEVALTYLYYFKHDNSFNSMLFLAFDHTIQSSSLDWVCQIVVKLKMFKLFMILRTNKQTQMVDEDSAYSRELQK